MNVIVIVTDSLRADHLGCYENEWIQTPNLDRLAQEAALFEQAFDEGIPTMPTRTAWWTGKFTFPLRGWQRFDHNDVLLAEVLWDQGFTSALITDVYHMHKPGMNCGRGFDTVQWIRGQEYDPWIVDRSIEIDADRHWKPDPDAERNAHWRRNFEQYLRNISVRRREEDHFVAQVCKAGIRWLEEHHGRDHLFLWLDCFDPHEPWDPPPPYDRMYNRGYEGQDIIDPVPREVEGYLSEEELNNIKSLYAGEVTLVDKWVGMFLDAAREMGFYENTLIMHTTDHGEPFGEHGIVRKARPWPDIEVARIPWLVRLPDGTGHGERISALVETCDLMPTVLEFLGVEAPKGMTGSSLLPLMRGEREQVRDYAYCGFFNQAWSIRSQEWSFIMLLPNCPQRPSGPRELYSRRDDPAEQSNLIAEHPEVADGLELELRRFVAEMQRRG
ncbi:MAG: sulfatase [Armatimonadota bacterium]